MSWGGLQVPSLGQSKEQISGRRLNRDIVGPVPRAAGVAACDPVSRRCQIVVLLQGVAAAVGPGDDGIAARICDSEIWYSCCLGYRDEAPKSSGQGIISSRHRSARIRLPDGATHGIDSARAGAATTGDLEPVNGILLRETDCRKQQTEE